MLMAYIERIYPKAFIMRWSCNAFRRWYL